MRREVRDGTENMEMEKRETEETIRGRGKRTILHAKQGVTLRKEKTRGWRGWREEVRGGGEWGRGLRPCPPPHHEV